MKIFCAVSQYFVNKTSAKRVKISSIEVQFSKGNYNYGNAILLLIKVL